MDRVLAWAKLRYDVLHCTDCLLHRDRQRAVPGEGSRDADVMFVGEAPGPVEDRTGRPFVGPSGQYLREALHGAGFDPALAYITNTCRCYPPDCRAPSKSERMSCRRHLVRTLTLLKPKLVVPVGGVALGEFCQEGHEYITREHGKVQQSRYIGNGRWQLYPIYHPAAAMRRRNTWGVQFAEDVQKLLNLLTI